MKRRNLVAMFVAVAPILIGGCDKIILGLITSSPRPTESPAGAPPTYNPFANAPFLPTWSPAPAPVYGVTTPTPSSTGSVGPNQQTQSPTPQVSPTPTPTPKPASDPEPVIYDLKGNKDRFFMQGDYYSENRYYIKFLGDNNYATFSVMWGTKVQDASPQDEDSMHSSMNITRDPWFWVKKTVCVIAEGAKRTKKVCAFVADFPDYDHIYPLASWSVVVTPTATSSGQ